MSTIKVDVMKGVTNFLYPGDNIPRWLRLHVINLARKKIQEIHTHECNTGS